MFLGPSLDSRNQRFIIDSNGAELSLYRSKENSILINTITYWKREENNQNKECQVDSFPFFMTVFGKPGVAIWPMTTLSWSWILLRFDRVLTFWHIYSSFNFRRGLNRHCVWMSKNSIFGDGTTSRISIHRWYGAFNRCRSLIKEELREGSLKSVNILNIA